MRSRWGLTRLEVGHTKATARRLGRRIAVEFDPRVMLFRREAFAAIGQFATNMRIREDFDLLVRMREWGLRGGRHSDIVLVYRRHACNV
jgi:hypothetical protein